ncbi:MAG: alpha/beta hydrolase [Spirochaetes bacterium]|nr:alpha/beta hydrolase [Spirochaetota bacterium]
MKKSIILIAIVLLGGILMKNIFSSTGDNGKPRSLYKSDKGRKTAMESYDKAMKLWSVDFADDWVDTDYGRTHVVVSGPVKGKPLFLIPGLFADAAMWYANAGDLSEQYRVYTLDMINYAGKSEPAGKAVLKAEDYAAWFQAVIKHFGYDKAAIAGLSYGSYISLAIAREIPDSIAAMVLMDPSESFATMDGGIAWKGFWAFAFFPNREKYGKFFDWMGGGYTDPSMDVWFEHMLDCIEFSTLKIYDLIQQIYTREELLMVKMPVLVMAGGKPILYKDPVKFAAAVKEALPHAEMEIVPDAGHGLNMEKPEYVNKRTLEFLSRNY